MLRNAAMASRAAGAADQYRVRRRERRISRPCGTRASASWIRAAARTTRGAVGSNGGKTAVTGGRDYRDLVHPHVPRPRLTGAATCIVDATSIAKAAARVSDARTPGSRRCDGRSRSSPPEYRPFGSNSSTKSTCPNKGGFMKSVLLDVAGHRRSPATMPGYHRGRAPRNKGEQYPADPPTVEEIVTVMRAVGDRADGHRLRALIVLLWRAGLRISEALALLESDLDRSRGAVLVRRGKGGKRREVGMDRWAWDQLDPWLEIRRELPLGALLCVIHGPTAGRSWEASAARKQLHHAAAQAGIRRRFALHQLRHAHPVEMKA